MPADSQTAALSRSAEILEANVREGILLIVSAALYRQRSTLQAGGTVSGRRPPGSRASST